MKMPFGKHKGKKLEEILAKHPQYIMWLAENCELKGELKKFCKDHYQDAEDNFGEMLVDASRRRARANGGGYVDFLGTYCGEDGYDDPNFGWVSYNDEDY